MGAKSRPVEDRFWEKVNIKTELECWEWEGSKYYNGYGQFYKAPMKIVAHRMSYELTYGEIRNKKLLVCHKCDNRGCVNPNHLFLGTFIDNFIDMDNKNRRVIGDTRGEKNGRAKLTVDDVLKIRKSYIRGQISAKKLGEKYGIAESTCLRIINNQGWKHVK